MQEELAFVFEMLQQLEDALVQYDELDALFSQYVVNFGAGGEWCRGPASHACWEPHARCPDPCAGVGCGGFRPVLSAVVSWETSVGLVFLWAFEIELEVILLVFLILAYLVCFWATPVGAQGYSWECPRPYLGAGNGTQVGRVQGQRPPVMPDSGS